MNNKNDKKLFTLLASADEKTLYKICLHYLIKCYDKKNIRATPEYIYAIGSIPILLVAHLDTVLAKPPKVYYIKNKKIFIGSEGLGADDRAGILGILKLLKKGYRPSVLFTTMEEIGGLGALTLVKDYPKAPPSPIKYIIELDRKGFNECVFYKCNNPAFFKYINSFGFQTNKGIFSDISFICPNWNIAGVNLSVGYYNEHTEYEYFVLEDLYNTLEKVELLLLESSTVPSYCFDITNSKDFIYYTYCSICGKTIPMTTDKIIRCEECKKNELTRSI